MATCLLPPETTDNFLPGCGWQSCLCWFAEKPPKIPIYQYCVDFSAHLPCPHLSGQCPVPPSQLRSPAAVPVCPQCWMGCFTPRLSGDLLFQQTTAVSCLTSSGTVLIVSPADIIHGKLTQQWYSYLSTHISATAQVTHVQCYSCFRALSLLSFFKFWFVFCFVIASAFGD